MFLLPRKYFKSGFKYLVWFSQNPVCKIHLSPRFKRQCRDHHCVTECFVFQYIVMNSVEERMLSLQEQKRTLMGQAFGLQTQSQEERRRARVRDIKHLIGL